MTKTRRVGTLIRYKSISELNEIERFATKNNFKSVPELYRKCLELFAGDKLKSNRDKAYQQILEMQESVITRLLEVVKKIEDGQLDRETESQISTTLTSLKLTNDLIKGKIIKG